MTFFPIYPCTHRNECFTHWKPFWRNKVELKRHAEILFIDWRVSAYSKLDWLFWKVKVLLILLSNIFTRKRRFDWRFLLTFETTGNYRVHSLLWGIHWSQSVRINLSNLFLWIEMQRRLQQYTTYSQLSQFLEIIWSNQGRQSPVKSTSLSLRLSWHVQDLVF